MPEHGRDNLLVRLPHTIDCWRTLILDHLVELREIVVRHHRKHVMFDVIVHVGIEKAEDRVHNYSPTVQAMIVDIFGQPSMLAVIEDLTEQPSVEAW